MLAACAQYYPRTLHPSLHKEIACEDILAFSSTQDCWLSIGGSLLCNIEIVMLHSRVPRLAVPYLSTIKASPLPTASRTFPALPIRSTTSEVSLAGMRNPSPTQQSSEKRSAIIGVKYADHISLICRQYWSASFTPQTRIANFLSDQDEH